MTYDPFRRGEHQVGVRSVDLHDEQRDRKLVAEVWFPQDAPAGLALPLAVFSHGFAGHRRQSTFFTQHLAGHGWVVVAPDHTGNTFMDFVGPGGRRLGAAWKTSMEERPGDVRFLIDAAATGKLGATVDTTRVAMTGHSFGGWTSLRVVADEPRIAAVVALAPAAGVPQLRAAIDLAWTREVPTMVIAAERDSLLPVAGIEEVFAELRAPATLVVLAGTDHMHFCDGAREIHELFRAMPIKLVETATPLPPFDELSPARNGHETACGLGLAHLDAHLRGDAEARAFLAGDLAAVLAARGISVSACGTR